MQWSDLFAALALVLIIEGIFPFLNPSGLRRALDMMQQLSDQQLRTAGLLAMAIGVVLLFWVKA